MTFPKVLTQVWQMENSDINVVGEYLGYDWNQVCDEIRKAEFYAMDGDGTFSIYRSIENNYSSSEIINKIMEAIFENYSQIMEINISN